MSKKEMLDSLEETIDSLNNYYDSVDFESAKIVINDAIENIRSAQWYININKEV